MGVVLHELLTGDRPFKDESPRSLADAILGTVSHTAPRSASLIKDQEVRA
jgi:hypothetical protein